MPLLALIEEVRKAAEADQSGDHQAHNHLLQTIHRLNIAAENPAETASRLRFQPLHNACIRIAIETGLLNAVAAHDGRTVSAAELSKETALDELLVVRLMRVLTAVGMGDEVGEGQYQANEVAKRTSTPGWSGGERHHYDLFIPIGANLVDMIRKSAFHQTAERPGGNIPFNYTFGVPIWKYYELHPSVREDFDKYMVARREGMLAQWHEIYPAASRLGSDLRQDPEAVLLVDVGGGRGHDLQSFQQRHPDVPGRLIVQDLPAVLDQLVGPLEGIEVMRYDLFTPQPIKGARAYFFRNILHGWPDKHCIEFLSNTVQAMDKDRSIILIDEFVLPNTGAGLRAVSMDILMMMYVGAIERTECQWHKLLDSAGLEIVKIWSISPDYESVIEARRKA